MFGHLLRMEEVQAMMEKLKQEEEKLKKAENAIAVMTMLKEGTVPEAVATAGEVFLCLTVSHKSNQQNNKQRHDIKFTIITHSFHQTHLQ